MSRGVHMLYTRILVYNYWVTDCTLVSSGSLFIRVSNGNFNEWSCYLKSAG